MARFGIDRLFSYLIMDVSQPQCTSYMVRRTFRQFRTDRPVLSLMDRLGVRNVARQARYFDADIEQAFQLIFTGHCSVC